MKKLTKKEQMKDHLASLEAERRWAKIWLKRFREYHTKALSESKAWLTRNAEEIKILKHQIRQP